MTISRVFHASKESIYNVSKGFIGSFCKISNEINIVSKTNIHLFFVLCYSFVLCSDIEFFFKIIILLIPVRSLMKLTDIFIVIKGCIRIQDIFLLEGFSSFSDSDSKILIVSHISNYIKLFIIY